ncbi:YaiI/YqxD family protein [bacterium]|nr:MULTISPECIES: YaiI/YqxD family protein [Pirellulaceae]MDB4338495.1 YaiI/YqxD family protein [Rubripirellula sp.]MDB4679268.1 YaiI/YqxD family protein [Rhodopirellula sp.]MDB4809726.1 YaiI/YqxD family protein [bacterium]MDC0279090.1 YaiI/YqxD family protein [bacterium]
MRIWIDADAAPRDVKEVVFRAALRLSVDTVLVANQRIAVPANAATVSMVVVREGADVADRHIVEKSVPGDLVVTADIPLAALLVEKNVDVIDPRGEAYDASNIASRLSMRNFMDHMRGAGMATEGSRPYGDQDKKAFANTFDRLLTKLLKQAGK